MDTISIEDFQKLDLRIAKVTAAEAVAGTDKLLKLTLDVGDPSTGPSATSSGSSDSGQGLGERIIATSIKPWYAPEDLVGKNIVYLANLEPRTFKGVVSQGMLIAAGADECVLLFPDHDMAPGTKVH